MCVFPTLAGKPKKAITNMVTNMASLTSDTIAASVKAVPKRTGVSQRKEGRKWFI